MEETIQCFPQELRTLHPRRWSTENVCAWVTSWEAGGHEINADAPSVTANSVNTSKTKEIGQKRKRYCFSVVQTTFLEVQLKDGNLDS